MKQLFYALAILLLSTEFVLAAPPKKPRCDSFDQVIEFLEGLDYQPLMGADSKTADRIAVWIRDDGFVVVENFGDKKLCVTGVAQGGFRSDKDALLKLFGKAEGATNAVDRSFESR